MNIDLNLIRRESSPREQISIGFYSDTLAELKAVCDGEQIKVSHLIRSLVNNFLDERKKRNGSKIPTA